jgi:hypothetical protein
MPMSLQLSISQRRNGEPVLGAAVGARRVRLCDSARWPDRALDAVVEFGAALVEEAGQPPAHERIADCFSEFVF